MQSSEKFTYRERVVLGAMIRVRINQALQIESYGMKPAATSEELKTIYKKVAGFEWKED